jgi:hypothetical protein
MQLNAITMGYAVPQIDFEARVHSVFELAANLQPRRGTDLITLITSIGSDLPQGIRLDTPRGFTFDGLQLNDLVTCRENMLSFRKSTLRIDLGKAQRWKCNFQDLNIDSDQEIFQKTWRLAWRILNNRQTAYRAEIVAENLFSPHNKNGSVMFQHLSDGITLLVRVTADLDPLVTSAVSALIGLGTGLTPSGDDLLVGFITGLFCRAGKDDKRKRFISGLGKEIISLSNGTTDVSHTYLVHAAHGQVSRNLADLATSICMGLDNDTLYKSSNSAMTSGHTSGMDTVTGLLLGLAVWDGELLCWDKRD